MERKDLIAQVKELATEGKVELSKPAHQLKTEELEKIIQDSTKVKTEVAEVVEVEAEENVPTTETEVKEDVTEDLSKVPHPTDVLLMANGEKKPMATRIKELGRQGMSKRDIEIQMNKEGFKATGGGPVRYAYIFVVLKDAGIKVPKKIREKKVQEEAVKEVTVTDGEGI